MTVAGANSARPPSQRAVPAGAGEGGVRGPSGQPPVAGAVRARPATGLPTRLEAPWSETEARGSSRLFAVALALACAMHLGMILGVQLAPAKAGQREAATHALEVVLVRQPSADETPEVADALAQVDRVGGGVEEPADAPPPREPDAVQEGGDVEPMGAVDPVAASGTAGEPAVGTNDDAAAVPEPAPATPDEAGRLAATTAAEVRSFEVPEPPALSDPLPLPEPPPEPAIEPEPEPPPVTAAEILASRSEEVAALTARIRHSAQAYANRPRRRAISASTREYKYASYLEAWRRKVERIGNLNYPEEAKQHKMYGNLILTVSVRADGSIEQAKVVRSSGFDLLDEAAIAIVRLAAPYAPFPPDIRAEADVLDITRTWQFQRSNRLGWEN